ncbi:hypothetical protein MMC07_003059 [Pseudocyphellaria aurata]|nr:hypothetical protein [Pseudocyphellaria aurata]
MLATGNPNGNPVLMSSTGNDLIDLHSSTDQPENGQFQPNQFQSNQFQPSQFQPSQFQPSQLLTGQLTAYKTPQSAIDQIIADQPAIDQTTSGDDITDRIPPDMVPTADLQLAEYIDIPPVSQAPLGVTRYVIKSFSSISAGRCAFGIYVVADDKMNFHIQKCGKSNELPNLPKLMSDLTPCLAVLKAKEKGQFLSILYYEADSDVETDKISLLREGRGDFEAELHQATHSTIIRKDARNRATLLDALGVTPAKKPQ